MTATSHKVIRNLLDEVRTQAAEGRRRPFAIGRAGWTRRRRRARRAGDSTTTTRRWTALAAARCNVLGGTAWLWSREEFAGAVDVLFVDEAGQMSLANVLAVSQAANSLVLLGDPQQLEQPQKASHPDGVGVSALEHVLGGHADDAAGPRHLPADHLADVTDAHGVHVGAVLRRQARPPSRASSAGADRHRRVRRLAACGSSPWTTTATERVDRGSRRRRRACRRAARPAAGSTRSGTERPLTAGDIRIVAPFNAQVNRLAERLGRGRAGRHRGQVPGPDARRRHLLDGDVAPRGRAARHGVSLQPEPPQRRHVTRPMCGVPRGLAAAA